MTIPKTQDRVMKYCNYFALVPVSSLLLFLAIVYIRKVSLEETISIEDNLKFDDERLIELIKKRHFRPPSTKNYNLIEENNMVEFALFKARRNSPPTVFMNKVLKILFEDEPPGMYLEVGAADGEFKSSSLYLEYKLRWDGLLVEPNSYLTKKMVAKNRKAMTSDLCMGFQDHSYKGVLKYPSVSNAPNALVSIHSKGILANTNNTNFVISDTYEIVNCVPLISLLKAANVSRIHALFININDGEEHIINKFQLGKFPVDVWIVRHLNKTPFYPEKTFDFSFVERFANCGYEFYAFGHWDMIYVMINASSYLYENAMKKRPKSLGELVKPFKILYPIALK